MYLRKNVQWTGEMCTSLRRAALGHCVGSGGGGAAVGSRGRGLPYHSTERAWRSVRRHCGSSPSTAAHKLNLLCTWWKLFPHFCRMRKLLLLIIFPLNAVGSIFSPALLLFSYLDPISTTDKETDESCDIFIIWKKKINSGLVWAARQYCEKKFGPIMSNFWGPFFYVFIGTK